MGFKLYLSAFMIQLYFFYYVVLSLLFLMYKLQSSNKEIGLTRLFSDKESACPAGDMGPIPMLGRSPEKEMATHSSIVAWEIPWTEEPGRTTIHGAAKSQTWINDNSKWRKIKISKQILILSSLILNSMEYLWTYKNRHYPTFKIMYLNIYHLPQNVRIIWKIPLQPLSLSCDSRVWSKFILKHWDNIFGNFWKLDQILFVYTKLQYFSESQGQIEENWTIIYWKPIIY